MKFSMTGKEKCDLLIQVTAWVGLTVLNKIDRVANIKGPRQGN
jgi:hypothetical protein